MPTIPAGTGKRDDGRHRRPPLTRRFAHKVALGLAVAAFVALVLVPIFLVPDQGTADSPADIERISLIALSGPGVLVALAIPVLLAGLPLLLRGRITAVLTAVLLFAFAIFTLLGIGVFFLPAALAAVVALFLPSDN
ncbi:hypothetical protein EXU48_06095 [Occultella glacieicola]|uniref:Uncharacterized protein n=1 Tax=Occultella glacieicola TaxID=2518684 RepID=A0ABY2EAD9_9MICO|nr:hypothetical protein [Occultella glacieicola]TDE95830.1 hypothetical protein EXU48_06095 [Occultella glacieicola]